MSIKNIPLNIHKPGVSGACDTIVFAKAAAVNDYFRIPRRYPFVDIANLTALRTAKYFRHALTGGVEAVSGDLGGSSTTNTEGKLGFQLPPTEKLILLVKQTGVASTGTAKAEFVIKGSLEYNTPDVTVTFDADAAFVSGTRIREVDIYNLGEYITGVAGESGVMIKVTADESTPALEFALIARVG